MCFSSGPPNTLRPTWLHKPFQYLSILSMYLELSLLFTNIVSVTGNLGLLRLFQEIWSWQCCSSCYSSCRPAIAAPCTVCLGVDSVSAVVVVIVVVDRDVVLANLWELHYIAALKAQTRFFSIICVKLRIFWQHHINQDIWDLMFAYSSMAECPGRATSFVSFRSRASSASSPSIKLETVLE